ncbi:hypothetical protein ADUPG1_002207, partial [Aduncisulcus paluster]
DKPKSEEEDEDQRPEETSKSEEEPVWLKLCKNARKVEKESDGKPLLAEEPPQRYSENSGTHHSEPTAKPQERTIPEKQIAPVISCAVRFLENTEKEAVDDFGCVKVQLKISDANCKGVMAIMDTGSDLSLMSQDWAYDRGRLHREDPWLDTHLRYPDTEFRRKRLESPVVFKTIDGNTAEVNEAITIETTVLKAKGRKETEHTSPVEYWITPLLPVDTPVLIGKPAMRKLGITLNV